MGNSVKNPFLQPREARDSHRADRKVLRISRTIVAAVVAWAVAGGACAVAAAAADVPTAGEVYRATGVRGGLVVHVGCGEGELTAALRANERFLVQGLERDAAKVARARAMIRAKGLYGPVSVERLAGDALPYADNLVNLLVVEDAGGVGREEMLRVLCPGGAAYLRVEGKWTHLVKPRPGEIDEWTHYLHDASNNAVAADTQVGPPRRLRWVAEPLWARSHEFISSLSAMVSAGGRLFYVFDEGLTGITTPTVPERWTLIARDAFNGVLLWKRPLPDWRGQGKSRALRSVPATTPRRLVAQDDRVFVTLSGGGPVSILDAATGEPLATCEGSDGTDELRLLDGVLLLRKGTGELLAADAATGRKLWQAPGKAQALTLAARNGRAFYQAGKELHCVDLRTGQPRWKAAVASAPSLLLVADGRVLLAGRMGIEALSAETGKALWSSDARIVRAELFVAGGRIWHWDGEKIAGLDPATGKPATTLDTDDVFTPGHHLRCYQSKATERFLITPNRGVEFVSLRGEANTESDWVRGPCRYGILPCNGLLYAPPNPCFCYPGVKITGFNALAPAVNGTPAAPDTAPRLEKGPAFSSIGNRKSQIGNEGWPTYRHDPRRSGATASAVPAELAERWKVRLAGRLTPPVACDGRAYVAARDEHTLHALGLDDGKERWRFIAGGPIDSPPTVDGERVLFGCADGWVYCLRAADGELAWRFRAAPVERRIVAFGRLESPWRVHGSVLVSDGVAYGTAGRSTYMDGGIRLFALDTETGKALHTRTLDTWARTRKDAEGKPFVPGYHMEGAFSDILVGEGGFLYMGQHKLDRSLAEQPVPYVMPGPDDKTVGMDLTAQPFTLPDEQPKSDYETHQRKWIERTQAELVADLRKQFGGYSLGQRQMGPHVLATGGFLDDSWYNRTYWMYTSTWPGYYLAHRGAKTGQLLVVGPRRTYAVQAFASRNLQSPLFAPGEKGYLLYADENDNEPVLDHRTRETTKGWGFTRTRPPAWHAWVPVRIRAMVLTGASAAPGQSGILFVAGPPDVADPADPMAAFEGRKGAVLRAVSADDGKPLGERKLAAPPVFDGLIAAAGRLLMTTTDGHVVCLGAAR